MVREAAERYGFSVSFYGSAAEALPEAADFEVLFGCDCPEVVRAAENLKWFACAYAGIDPYVSDGVWGNPACLLSNSAGAYGTAIAEYVVMALLMLLRRMPGYGWSGSIWTICPTALGQGAAGCRPMMNF